MNPLPRRPLYVGPVRSVFVLWKPIHGSQLLLTRSCNGHSLYKGETALRESGE